MHVVRMVENSNTYGEPVGKSKGKRPPGKRRRRREVNVYVNLKELT